MKKTVLSIILSFVMLSTTICSFPVYASGYEDEYDGIDFGDNYHDGSYVEPCEHEWFRKTEVVKKRTPYHGGEIIKECAECGDRILIRTPKKKITAKEKKAAKVVKNFFNAAKKYDATKIQTCIEDKAKLFINKKYMADICRKYNKKYLKYEITNVRTKGNKMYVKVDVTYPDGEEAFTEAFIRAYEDIYQNLPNNPDYVIPAYKIEAYIKLCVARYKMETSSLTKEFKIGKVRGKYKIIGFNQNINNVNIINCGYETAFEDFFE